VEDLYHLSVLLIMIVAAISQTPSSGDIDHAIRSYGVDGCVFEVKDNVLSGVWAQMA
jgi:hypothetical protein